MAELQGGKEDKKQSDVAKMLNKSTLYLINTISNQRHRPGQKRGLCGPRSPRPHHLPCNDISCHFCCKSLDISFRIPLLCQGLHYGTAPGGKNQGLHPAFSFLPECQEGDSWWEQKTSMEIFKTSDFVFFPPKI